MKKLLVKFIEIAAGAERPFELEFENPQEFDLKELKAEIKKSKQLSTKKDFYIYFKGKRLGKGDKEIQWESLIKDKTQNGRLILHIRPSIKLGTVRSLKRQLESNGTIEHPYGVLDVSSEDEETVRRKIQDNIIQFLIDAVESPKTAAFKIPSRDSSNVGYEPNARMMLLGNQLVERTYRNLSSCKSIAQMAGVMKLLDDVLKKRIHVTKRDLFYTDVNLFGDQRVSDNLIEDIGAMLQVTRQSLNVNASAKGKVLGKLAFKEDGDYIDCSIGVGGHSITPMINKITDLESDAELVLVVEKDAAFQRLAEDKFFNFIPSIMITASGQPDLATRMFVKRLREELDLPVLSLMDADPYGFEIMRVYSLGSKAMSLESVELAVPDIKWLGLLPRDLDEYKISKDVRIKMSETDDKRADDLLKEDFIAARPEWKKEIQLMKKTGEKAEIQALASRDLLFMTNVYLPNKIESGDWI